MISMTMVFAKTRLVPTIPDKLHTVFFMGMQITCGVNEKQFRVIVNLSYNLERKHCKVTLP